MFSDLRTGITPRDFFNHVFVSLVHKYIFIATPKVANSTLRNILFQIALEDTPFTVGNIYDRLESPLLSPYQLGEGLFNEILEDPAFTTFGFVRDPYTRLLSAYLDRVCRPTVTRRRLLAEMGLNLKEHIEFQEFINYVCSQSDERNDPHWRPQNRALLSETVTLDFIGRFEKFGEDALDILSKVIPDRIDFLMEKLKENHAPSVTSAASKLAGSYHGIDTSPIKEKYARDFKLYGYSPELSL